MKPRKNYRMRPVKHGAVKRQKILAQKRRLVAAGYDMEALRKLTTVEIRDLLKKTAKKKSPNKVSSKKTSASKKTVSKKTAAKKPAAKPKKKD